MKILLIDDDEIGNFISIKLLKKVNPDLEIKACLNGQTGLEIFNEFKPDVVFVDNNMPIVSGFEFLEKVEKDSGCKFYMLMSSLFSGDINRAKNLIGPSNIVSKPLSVQKLTEIL